MQCDDATIKQSGCDEMHYGARYNNEARRDATTRILDDDEMDDERRDVAQRRGAATRRDGMRCNSKGQRDDATTNQRNKQTDEQTNKVGAT